MGSAPPQPVLGKVGTKRVPTADEVGDPFGPQAVERLKESAVTKLYGAARALLHVTFPFLKRCERDRLDHNRERGDCLCER